MVVIESGVRERFMMSGRVEFVSQLCDSDLFAMRCSAIILVNTIITFIPALDTLLHGEFYQSQPIIRSEANSYDSSEQTLVVRKHKNCILILYFRFASV